VDSDCRDFWVRRFLIFLLSSRNVQSTTEISTYNAVQVGPEEVGPGQVAPLRLAPLKSHSWQDTALSCCLGFTLCANEFTSLPTSSLGFSILGVFGLDASGVVESFVGADGASGAELQLIIRAEANIKSIPAVKVILCIFMGHSLLHPLIV